VLALRDIYLHLLEDEQEVKEKQIRETSQNPLGGYKD
jgi:hypothetical protein